LKTESIESSENKDVMSEVSFSKRDKAAQNNDKAKNLMPSGPSGSRKSNTTANTLQRLQTIN
jgi:hypothetical protein